MRLPAQTPFTWLTSRPFKKRYQSVLEFRIGCLFLTTAVSAGLIHPSTIVHQKLVFNRLKAAAIKWAAFGSADSVYHNMNQVFCKMAGRQSEWTQMSFNKSVSFSITAFKLSVS